MKPPIVILTDFGTADPFVGIMKGVISSISPGTTIIDLTHEIPPGDIRRGAIVLWQSLPYFPKGTIFLSVIDPGVGTRRCPIIMKTQGHTFIGPDNGTFTFVMGKSYQAWELGNPQFGLPNPRKTFHGRDIFAPGAAHAACGVSGPEFGEQILDLHLIPHPILENLTPGSIRGEILHGDHFGNALTSLGIFSPTQNGIHIIKSWIGDGFESRIDLKNAYLHLPGGGQIIWAATFSEIPVGECAVIVGSSGLLEIAANRQSAVKLLNLKSGDPVTLNTS
jgi:S-adenosylmethionine hydrolase